MKYLTGIGGYLLTAIPLDYGFEVYLVNAYHVKNVSGRRSDMSDARWLQELHTFLDFAIWVTQVNT